VDQKDSQSFWQLELEYQVRGVPICDFDVYYMIVYGFDDHDAFSTIFAWVSLGLWIFPEID